MAELGGSDVQEYTNGRLQATDTETLRMLAAALAVARRYCGWHVSPVNVAQQMTLDGPASKILWLPTLKVVAIDSIVEDTITLDPSAYVASAGDGPGLARRATLRKTSRTKPFWSCNYSGIVLTMDHGYTETEAADWRQAILNMVDEMSMVPVSGSGMSEFGLASKKVDDVDYRFNAYSSLAEQVVFSMANILDDYRLPLDGWN